MSRRPSSTPHTSKGRARQLTLGNLKPRSPKGRGGARPGAGRPRIPEHKRGYVVHRARPEFKRATPAHVTLKLRAGRPSLRDRQVFELLRQAVAVARRKGLEIVHFSILSNHVHLILEPGSTGKLARALQSFSISFAKKLNRLTGQRGAVFEERYHLRLLKTPTEVRRALAYVLANEARHASRASDTYPIGPYSSSHAFAHWESLLGKSARYRITSDWSLVRLECWLGEALVPPRTWLLREGWLKGS